MTRPWVADVEHTLMTAIQHPAWSSTIYSNNVKDVIRCVSRYLQSDWHAFLHSSTGTEVLMFITNGPVDRSSIGRLTSQRYSFT
uniref:hypothetical protein n=1 Tax=Synechococcus sp. UW106 TaxID=368495 RepID=UPI0010BD34D7|nr:hypothetical protein [Synechococcus sp. UW106]